LLYPVSLPNATQSILQLILPLHTAVLLCPVLYRAVLCSWLGEACFLQLARAAEHPAADDENDEQPQLQPSEPEPEPELEAKQELETATQRPQQPQPRVCVFAEPELRDGVTEAGAECVGGIELMDQILTVSQSVSQPARRGGMSGGKYSHTCKCCCTLRRGLCRWALQRKEEAVAMASRCSYRPRRCCQR
jgi:hypothetical protein